MQTVSHVYSYVCRKRRVDEPVQVQETGTPMLRAKIFDKGIPHWKFYGAGSDQQERHITCHFTTLHHFARHVV